MLVRIHFIIVMIWWTGLAPWECEFPLGRRYLSRDFWTALNSKDVEVFYPLLRKYAFFLALGTPVSSTLNPEPWTLNPEP